MKGGYEKWLAISLLFFRVVSHQYFEKIQKNLKIIDLHLIIRIK